MIPLGVCGSVSTIIPPGVYRQLSQWLRPKMRAHAKTAIGTMVDGADRRRNFGQVALAAQEAGEEASALAGFLRGVRVARAALVTRHVGHDLLDVLAASGPRGFTAFATGGYAAHGVTPRGGGLGFRGPFGGRVLHIPLGVFQITVNGTSGNPRGYILSETTTTGGNRLGTGRGHDETGHQQA